MKPMNPQQKQKKQVNSPSINIKVLIRVRRLIQSQKNTENIIKILPDNKTMKVYNDEINYIQSKFDHVFDSQKNQKDIFQQISNPVSKIFQGYNLTVFAYGQTGSGKTYTMFGKDWQNIIDKQEKKQNTYYQNLDNDVDYAGIIPRAIYKVFNQAQKTKQKFNVYCSFLQIYNQKIYDLLQDSNNPKPLNIHESKVNGIFVQGLIQFQVQRFSDCLNLMKKGQRNRFIRQTSMNAKSSRSHTIFQILVQSLESNSQGNYIKSRLNLCDLAGSQKINKKQFMVNDHLQQLKNINLSLTTLGKVINSLSSNTKKGSINIAAFRESKLTRLLQQSLTLNTNTFIIGAISPSSKNIDETLNTLKFAQRASHITMKVKPLQFNQMNKESISKLKKEIQYLKQLLQMKKNGMEDEKIFRELQRKEKSNNINGNENSNSISNNNNNKSQQISQKQFEKLLQENRKMKKQIYSLQIDLQKIRSQNTNSSNTQRSNISSNYQSSLSDYQSKEQLRKQIYLQKFMKRKNQIYPNSPRQKSTNNSMFVTIGKATIQQNDKFNNNSNQNNSWLNSKQKLNILNRMEKMQSKKNYEDSLLIEQLENLQKFQIKNNSPYIKYKGMDSLDLSTIQQSIQPPKRYKQANVFRRNKMVSLSVQREKPNQIIHQDIQQQKKKKVDYSSKIKQLQARLYGFK